MKDSKKKAQNHILHKGDLKGALDAIFRIMKNNWISSDYEKWRDNLEEILALGLNHPEYINLRKNQGFAKDLGGIWTDWADLNTLHELIDELYTIYEYKKERNDNS